MSTRNSIWDKASMVAALSAALLSLVAGVMTVSFEKLTEIKIADPGLIINTEPHLELSEELEALKAQFTALQSVPEDHKLGTKLSSIETKLTQLESQISIINKAILQSPEKALEVPMLRRDIASLQKQYENSTKSLEREISRAYETVKWVIGTIVLGILGLAASVLFKERGE